MIKNPYSKLWWASLLGWLLFLISGIELQAQTGFNPDRDMILNWVSVNPVDNSVELNWEASTTTRPEFIGYLVYRDMAPFGSSSELFQIRARLGKVLNWIDNATNPNTRPESYKTALQTSTSGSGDGHLTELHRTIFLQSEFDTCSRKIDLIWTHYIGWQNNAGGTFDNKGVQKYQIFQFKADGTSELKGETNDTTFEVSVANADANYSFYVEATQIENNTFKSKSNMTSANSEFYKNPDFVHAKQSQVKSAELLDLHFDIDPAANSTNYALYRSTDPVTGYDSIYAFTHTNQKSLSYTDNFQTDKQQYYYKLYVLDKCFLNTPYISNSTSNILLEAVGKDGTYELNWSAYQEFPTPDFDYEVYALIDESEDLLSTQPSSNTSYQVDIQGLNITENSKEICFRVDARETAGSNGHSISNILCLPIEAQFYMPNALNPNSSNEKNRFFGPVSIIRPSKMHLTILNNWGRTIFESTDPNLYWDGSDNGKPASAGLYYYQVDVEFADGKKSTKKGSVYLIFK